MEDVVQADIFFFITTVAVVVLTIALTVALIYLVLILKSIRRLVRQLEERAAEISEDITELRMNVRGAVHRFSQFTSFFSVAQLANKVFSFFRGSSQSEKEEEYEEVDEDEGEWFESEDKDTN